MTTLTNKIKQYKGWHVERVEGVQQYNARQTQTPMFFRRTDTGELYKRGVVVSLRHDKGGEAKTLLKGKVDALLFINALENNQ